MSLECCMLYMVYVVVYMPWDSAQSVTPLQTKYLFGITVLLDANSNYIMLHQNAGSLSIFQDFYLHSLKASVEHNITYNVKRI